MCEYCGCLSVPAIAELTREHDEVVALVGQTRGAFDRGDLEAMVGLSRQIAAILVPHTVVEEQGLFPAMAAEFPEHVASLEAEHRQTEAVLAGATDGTAEADASWSTTLMHELDVLREHILKEQDGVFPAALSVLSNEQWDHVAQVRAAQGVAR